MKKGKKFINFRLIAIVAMILTVAIYFTTAGSMNFYVNGKQVASKQGQPFVKSGITYVPLQATVKGMGGTYSYNSKKKVATIKAKGSKTAYTITVNQNVAKVGKKSVALASKKVKNKWVNANAKATLVKNVVYVPVDFLKAYFKYPVTIKKSGKTTTVYIGAVPKPKPAPKKPAPKPAPKPVTPKPTPKPAPKTTAPTFNKGAVINSLGSQGFCKDSSTLATLNIFNPGGCNGNMSVAVDLTNDKNMFMLITAWQDPYTPETKLIPQKVKSALTVIIPSGANNIFNIINNIDARGYHKDLNKTYTYNGIKTKVTFVNGQVKVIFTK